MSAAQPNGLRIFVSHSAADSVFGFRLVEDLRRVLGDPTTVWFDRAGGLHGGDNWWQTILNEITSREVFLVIWSPDAKGSDWVNEEVDVAWHQAHDPAGKKIIPLVCRACPLREDLRTRLAISFVDPEAYEQSFGDLLVALGASGDPATTAPFPATPVTPELSSSPAIGPAPAEPAHSTSAMGASDIASLDTMVQRTPLPTLQQAPLALPMLLLLSIEGLWPPTRVPLNGSTLTVGRESGNDVLLADPAVSRFHLDLKRAGAGWLVQALPGTKPLYVNGERRETARLGNGDQIVVGNTALRLEQPFALANATTLNSTDMRTVLAVGLAPELGVECPNVRFAVPLRRDELTLGRAPECSIVVPSPLISAQQATLRRLPNGDYELESDRHAHNSLTLDGHPLRQHTLQQGETLIIGSRAHNAYVALTYSPAGPTNLASL